jgi:hypothetical protein
MLGPFITNKSSYKDVARLNCELVINMQGVYIYLNICKQKKY